ncbi:hypothetical protein BDC45DRAFT_531654 [Circinella umbellata]|nr:hypothetical protein BDC45DRAFT_531654 [Circinella umbellata]
MSIKRYVLGKQNKGAGEGISMIVQNYFLFSHIMHTILTYSVIFTCPKSVLFDIERIKKLIYFFNFDIRKNSLSRLSKFVAFGNLSREEKILKRSIMAGVEQSY